MEKVINKKEPTCCKGDPVAKACSVSKEHYGTLQPIIVSSLRTYHREINMSSTSLSTGTTNNIIDTVIDRLERLGYLNDLEFAKWWVEQRQTHSPRGARLIKSELFQKGMAQEVIEEVLSEDEEGEVEQALKAAKKKLRSYQKLNHREFKQKMGQYLARRGFDWEVIKETLDHL